MAAACVTLLSCDSGEALSSGTYHGTMGQVLVIDGHDFS